MEKPTGIVVVVTEKNTFNLKPATFQLHRNLLAHKSQFEVLLKKNITILFARRIQLCFVISHVENGLPIPIRLIQRLNLIEVFCYLHWIFFLIFGPNPHMGKNVDRQSCKTEKLSLSTQKSFVIVKFKQPVCCMNGRCLYML